VSLTSAFGLLPLATAIALGIDASFLFMRSRNITTVMPAKSGDSK
jgi:hypothetical protein